MDTPAWLNLAQTIAVIATLLFTGYEFKVRVREQRFRNYLDSISGYIDLAKLMVERQELHDLYCPSNDDIVGDYNALTPSQKARVNYCDSILALCETIWYAHDEEWLSSDEWEYWMRWLRQLKHSPDFRWTLRWVKDDYDQKFIQLLRNTLQMNVQQSGAPPETQSTTVPGTGH